KVLGDADETGICIPGAHVGGGMGLSLLGGQAKPFEPILDIIPFAGGAQTAQFELRAGMAFGGSRTQPSHSLGFFILTLEVIIEELCCVLGAQFKLSLSIATLRPDTDRLWIGALQGFCRFGFLCRLLGLLLFELFGGQAFLLSHSLVRLLVLQKLHPIRPLLYSSFYRIRSGLV